MAASIDIAYILGAGASLSAGYPLAGGIRTALQTFAASLAGREDCRRLKASAENLMTLMEKRGCRTIDELAFELRGQDQGRVVLEAKAVMTALFIDLERTANLATYRRAVRTMVDLNDLALPPDGEMRVPTRAICLNYNYDRCLAAAMYLEIAEPRSGRGSETEVRVQRMMNAGVSTMTGRIFEIDTSRFADLRMHGMLGTHLDDLDDESPVRGLFLDDFGRVPVSDKILSGFDGGHRERPSTMIFFPWETHLPKKVRELITATDSAAAAYLSRVREVRIVGYSMNELNASRLDRLLEHAVACRAVTIHDPSPDVAKRVEAAFARAGPIPRLIQHSSWEP